VPQVSSPDYSQTSSVNNRAKKIVRTESNGASSAMAQYPYKHKFNCCCMYPTCQHDTYAGIQLDHSTGDGDKIVLLKL
jgi:hypothetical protein